MNAENVNSTVAATCSISKQSSANGPIDQTPSPSAVDHPFTQCAFTRSCSENTMGSPTVIMLPNGGKYASAS